MGIRERHITLTEHKLLAAYNDAAHLKNVIGEVKPQELITCMARMAIDHLQRQSYNLDGVLRAVFMAHHGIHRDAVQEAWKRAQEGEAYPLALLAHQTSASTGKHIADLWKTDAEAIELLGQPIEAVGRHQLQKILHWSYKLACRVSQEINFDAYFSLLIHVLRHLREEDYDIAQVMLAMATEMRGEPLHIVERAWGKARTEDE